MSYGFSFNGTHSDDFNIIMTSRNRQTLPTPNDTYSQIPGRHGSFLFSGNFSDRVIEVDCSVVADSLIDLRSKMRDIANWLYNEERRELIFDDEDDKYYLGKLEASIDPEQITSRVAQFTLQFRCEPFAYGGEQQASFVSDAITVTNPGTFEALPTFKATFTASASELKFIYGGKYIRVVYGFEAGDLLEINCSTCSIFINGSRAIAKLDWQNSEFFSLPPGVNSLSITPTGVCNASTTFNPRWL